MSEASLTKLVNDSTASRRGREGRLEDMSFETHFELNFERCSQLNICEGPFGVHGERRECREREHATDAIAQTGRLPDSVRAQTVSDFKLRFQTPPWGNFEPGQLRLCSYQERTVPIAVPPANSSSNLSSLPPSSFPIQ